MSSSSFGGRVEKMKKGRDGGEDFSKDHNRSKANKPTRKQRDYEYEESSGR